MAVFDAIVFQFHKGAIETLVEVILLLLQVPFNSIKVRLKLSGAVVWVPWFRLSIP